MHNIKEKKNKSSGQILILSNYHVEKDIYYCRRPFISTLEYSDAPRHFVYVLQEVRIIE